MTPPDRELDPSVFRSAQSLTLYRLAKREHANLSGIGAALYPGRWNRPGQEALYTSLDVATPVLERLVHTPKQTIPSNLALMQIVFRLPWKPPPSGQRRRPSQPNLLVFSTLAQAHAAFEQNAIELRSALAIAVPSVIVPAWNVVFYPEHPLFWSHLSLRSIEPFQFDPRLFPEETTSAR